MDIQEAIAHIDRKEFRFLTSRSSGPGGQNVNKVNSKVELRFDISASTSLTDPEKEILFLKLKNRINSNGELVLTSQTERTQAGNKERVCEKFYSLIAKALSPDRPRKATRPTVASKAERLKQKKLRGDIKRTRHSGSNLSDE